MRELSKANTAEQTNPFMNTLLNGLILGISLALRVRPEVLVGAGDIAATSQIIAEMARSRFSALPDQERRAPRRVVSAPKDNKDAN